MCECAWPLLLPALGPINATVVTALQLQCKHSEAMSLFFLSWRPNYHTAQLNKHTLSVRPLYMLEDHSHLQSSHQLEMIVIGLSTGSLGKRKKKKSIYSGALS